MSSNSSPISQEEARSLLLKIASEPRCGCDGGNLSSSLWYFGIEPGGSNQINEKDCLLLSIPENVTGSDMDTTNEESYHTLETDFGRYFNQFCRAFLEWGTLEGTAALSDSWKRKILSEEGFAFKGNIYPLAKRNHELWESLDVGLDGQIIGKAEEVFGWTKPEYEAHMRQVRKTLFGETLAKNAVQNKTKVIVGTSTDEMNNFAEVFGADISQWEEIEIPVENQPKAYLAPVPGKKSSAPIAWLYVIPFFSTPGRGRLSFEAQRAYAEKLREVLSKKGVAL